MVTVLLYTRYHPEEVTHDDVGKYSGRRSHLRDMVSGDAAIRRIMSVMKKLY